MADRQSKARKKVRLGNSEARDRVFDSLAKLAYVRDALNQMEKGDFNGMDARDYAFFIRAGMEEAGKDLEQALLDFGVLESGREMFAEV